MSRSIFGLIDLFGFEAASIFQKESLMMTSRLLRSLWKTHQQRPSQSRTFLSQVRPQLEVLDERALPNATHAFHPISQLAVDIQHDVTDVTSDLQAVTKSLGASLTPTVTPDLTP